VLDAVTPRKALDLSFWPVVAILAVALPLVYDDSYVMAELILFGMYFAINLMWSLVLGTAGLYSFATLAFVGAGAYLCAWLSLNHGLPWWAYAPVGIAIGAVGGLLVALPAVRLRGVYFALLTIGLVEACNQYVTSDVENLGGAQGLVGADSIIPPSKQGLVEGYYWAYIPLAVIVALTLLVYWWVSSGKLGLRLRTARESEPVAQALGIDIPRARLAVFVITSGMLGLVGAFRAGYDAGANKSVFSFSQLLLLFAMIVVGGINSPKGILLGTAFLLWIEQHFISWDAPRLILLGGIMLALTLFTTDGLAGIPDQIRRWLRGRRGAPGAEDAATATTMGGGT
jgi:branched-chain amino acid transport system permease protein